VNPIYPPEDLRARIRGIVVLRVLVSETGVPVEVVILERARGHLTEAAVAAIRRWRFDSAFKAGQPVREWATVQVPFEAIPYPTAAPSATSTPTPG
jgi:protein TonB